MFGKVETKEEKAIKNGKWKEFNKHAVLIAEGCYVNDRKHGLWREYYDTGELLIEENYINGIQHGRYASYHPNGQVFSEGQYRNGRLEGYFRVYDENGRNIRNLLFINNDEIEETAGDRQYDRRGDGTKA